MKPKILDLLLVAEDEQDHADLICEALQSEGRLVNEIRCVKNGREALDFVFGTGEFELVEAKRPGLILLDIKMPEYDGFEVLKRVKSDDRTKSIPVVMLTTTSEAGDIEKALSLGANDYIVKPVSWANFEEKVRSLGMYWALVSDSTMLR